VLAAVRRLPALSRRRVKDRPLLPREVDAELVPAMWKRAVFSNSKLPQGAVDRDAYVVCVLEQLHRALKNRWDVFASPSNRWADPRARLLDGPRWEAMLPRIELPDLLFEVHSWTGFLDAFGHVSERRTRMEGLLVSLVALLVSQSCNIGLTPVIDTENKALTRSRLSHVDQNYVRAESRPAAPARACAPSATPRPLRTPRKRPDILGYPGRQAVRSLLATEPWGRGRAGCAVAGVLPAART
jgi:hypothetical protein